MKHYFYILSLVLMLFASAGVYAQIVPNASIPTFLQSLFDDDSREGQHIWHKPDSLMALPYADSIYSAKEYSIIAVLKSLEPDTLQLLWGKKEYILRIR